MRLLRLPRRLLRVPHDDSVVHIYPEVYIPERGLWVPADSTWDIELKGKHTTIHVNE